jgi:hypothetical protein
MECARIARVKVVGHEWAYVGERDKDRKECVCVCVCVCVLCARVPAIDAVFAHSRVHTRVQER